MLKVKTESLELRGIATRTTKANKTYYIVNVEDCEGTPYSLYCPNVEALPQGLKKGEQICVTCVVKFFSDGDKLIVEKVERVGA